MTADGIEASASVWETNDSGTGLAISTHEIRTEYLTAIGGETFLTAAVKLARHPDVNRVKVASEEHLAGMIFLAFVGRIRALDADGDFDFVLEGNPDQLFGEKTETVVEMKSVAGKWREHLRNIKLGQSYSIQIEELRDVLIDESPRILAAVEQLKRKMSEEDPRSREIFLAIHPLDRATTASLSIKTDAWLTTPLPIPKQTLAIDGLWLLVFPSLVARWSPRRRSWTRYAVRAESREKWNRPQILSMRKFYFSRSLKRRPGLDTTLYGMRDSRA
jgi:hypothetical protein